MIAPCSSRMLTVNECPALAARISGVQPKGWGGGGGGGGEGQGMREGKGRGRGGTGKERRQGE